jgi:hypothetical protein
MARRTSHPTPIVLDHVGGAIGLGPYAGKRDEVFASWSGHIRELAACPNVHFGPNQTKSAPEESETRCVPPLRHRDNQRPPKRFSPC